MILLEIPNTWISKRCGNAESCAREYAEENGIVDYCENLFTSAILNT